MVKHEHIPMYKVVRANGLTTSHAELEVAERASESYLKAFPHSSAYIYKLHSVKSVKSVVDTETIGDYDANYVLPFESRNEESCATLRKSEGQVIAGEGEYQGCRK